MFITHKVFLKWLLYLTIVIFAGVALSHFGIPQLVFQFDHIYLGTALFLMYLVAEILAANQAIWLSRQNVLTHAVWRWLHDNHGDVESVWISERGEVEIATEQDRMVVPNSLLSDHLLDLVHKAKLNPGQRIHQRVLLDNLADHVYFKGLIGDFIGSRIVWVGILATIVGVVLSFWPFVNVNGVDIEQIRANLGPFFRGIAVAFLPTAASFVFKIALDFNTRILTAGANELLGMVTRIGEAHVVPVLEKMSHGEREWDAWADNMADEFAAAE